MRVLLYPWLLAGLVTRRLVPAAALLFVLVATSCSSDGDPSAPQEEEDGSRSAEGDADGQAPDGDPSAPQQQGTDGGQRDVACPDSGEARAWEDGPSDTLVTLADGDDGPRVQAAVYPRPDYEGDPWSQWGQGIVLDDGRFLSALGDHLGPDGNSFLYEFDPERGRLTMISDVLSLADHEEGDWGYGKVHAQMVAGPCGEVYASTYWGTRDERMFDGGYEGDFLIRLDPGRRTIENLGTILEEHGVPSMAASTEGGLIYAEAAAPFLEDPQRGALVVMDMTTEEHVFATEDDEDHRGFRSMAVDEEGRVMFSRPDGGLARWDPATGEISELDVTLPGDFLRAATPPAPDGTIYGVTQNPDVLFALEPDGDLRELGEAAGYTTSLAMAPDGSRFWYVPGAHGNSPEQGTPIIEVDTSSGEQEVVVELDPLARDELGLTLGGTYNIRVDDTGSVLYLGMNAAEAGSEEAFGEVVLVVVELE